MRIFSDGGAEGSCLSAIAVREYRRYNRVQPVAGISLHRAALPSVLPKKTGRSLQDVLFLVELRGVEPLSEKLEAATSTYLADCCYSL